MSIRSIRWVPMGGSIPLLTALARAVLVAGLLVGCGVRGTGSPLRAEERAPAEAFEIRVWRAGRGLPPGLSAARQAELENERTQAIEDLVRRLTREEEGRLEVWLSSASTPDELWGAAAGTIAALQRYELSSLLLPALEPLASPARAVAAREALHALYGRWFTRPAELEPYLASVSGGAGTRLLLAASMDEEGRARERLLSDLAHRPEGAAAWLQDPDPRVRSGAARVLGQVFASETGDTPSTLEGLVAHLEGEADPQAFHDGLLACLTPLERAPADQPLSLRLRALLVEIARAEGEPRTLSAAQALARVPWRVEGPRDLGHVLTAIEALSTMLRGELAADQRRGASDPDPTVAVIAALRELSAQASASGMANALKSGTTRDALFAVLRDAGQSEAVCAAAAAALGPLARAADAPTLAAVLSDPAVSAPVKHALLGSLRAVLVELDVGGQGTGALLQAVAELTGARDADVRRRALALCADPALESQVRRLDPAFLLARLEHEDGRESTLELLRLLQRFARPDMLPALLSLRTFDGLCADPATLEEVAGLLQRLCVRSARNAMNAAARLAAVPAEETSLARLRHALALVAALDDPAAYELYPREHVAILEWVWHVVGAGVAARELVPQGLAFEQRVLEVHVSRAEKAEGETGALGTFETAHLTALLRADLFLGGVGRGSKPQVEAAFENAFGLADRPELRMLVLRDRARYRAAANECVKALSDYRRLAELGTAADSWLGIPDLRSAVELLGRLDEGGGQARSASAGEASDLLRRITARAAWRAEPASVRMQDLRDWARSALDSRDLERLRAVEAALADLPLTQLETQAEREPSPLWLGLTREASWFQELLDLRARIRMGLRDLEAAG
ncbi:MAG: hypothetical protein EXS08_07615 [Planctomycetes bacterium]|nr:hypothetical protein [Planctomycetota bacterium]